MKILNLYAGLGGNRTLWEGYDVTAVEYDSEIAAIYQDRFPNDTVIVADAHQYLLDHYAEYDLIWSSPPCPTHSSFRFNIGVRFRGVKPEYPDMRLYQEIILLESHYEGKWVVENVKPYYDYLIKPRFTLQRHPFWANFDVPERQFPSDMLREAQIPQLQEFHGIDLSSYKIANKRQLLRNCVSKEVGAWILQNAV